MTLPAIPSAASITTPEQIAEAGAALVRYAEQESDPVAVKQAADKWAAITEYVRRQSIEGVAQAEATLRRLEMRVGALLGPPERGGDRRSDDFQVGHAPLDSDARKVLRRMAANPDVVEQVIAESTDADPASRRKVLRAIENAREIDEANRWAKEHNAKLAASGYDPTDDKRREPILFALMGLIEAALRMEQVATPADVTWTLDTTKHLGQQMRVDLAAAIDTIEKYREDQ